MMTGESVSFVTVSRRKTVLTSIVRLRLLVKVFRKRVFGCRKRQFTVQNVTD